MQAEQGKKKAGAKTNNRPGQTELNLSTPAKEASASASQLVSGDAVSSSSILLQASEEALHEKLKAVGLGESVLKSIAKEADKRALLELLMRGEAVADLTIKALNAVNETSAGREVELLNLLSKYPGRLDILSNFLRFMGTEDPFHACAKAQLVLLSTNEVKTKQENANQTSLSSTAQTVTAATQEKEAKVSRAKPARVRGASGHLITDYAYCVFNKEKPEDSVGFFAKEQAVLSIFESFAGENYSTTAIRKRESRRAEILKELEAQIEIASPGAEKTSSLPDGRSHMLERNLQVYQDLRKAIDDYQAHLDNLLYGQHVDFPSLASIKLRSDAGGTLLGWFARQIKEDADMPSGLVLAYKRLVDPHIELSAQDERAYVQGLLAYQRLHSYIDIKAAFGAILSDLEMLEKLKADDPIMQKQGALLKVKNEINAILTQGRSEITLSEFASFVDRNSLASLRRDLNQRCFELLSSQWDSALNLFKPLMMTDGRWREDCLTKSVPMERLGRSIYGAKIGYTRVPSPQSPAEDALLSRAEFKAIKDALMYSTIFATDKQRMFCALPVVAFKEMAEKVVVAFRKAKYLDVTLGEFLNSQSAALGTTVKIDMQDASTLPQGFMPLLPAGKNTRPAESFLAEIQSKRQTPWSCEELLEIAKVFSIEKGDISKAGQQFRLHVKLGLVSEAHFWLLQKINGAAAGCRRVSECENEFKQARHLLENPLVLTLARQTKDLINSKGKYLSDLQYSQLRALSEIASKVGPITEAQQQALGQYKSSSFLTYSMSKVDRDPITIELQKHSFVDMPIVKHENGVDYVQSNLMADFEQEVKTNYLLANRLTDSQIRHLHKVGKGALAEDKQWFTPRTLPKISGAAMIASLNPQDNIFIAKGFLDALPEIMPE